MTNRFPVMAEKWIKTYYAAGARKKTGCSVSEEKIIRTKFQSQLIRRRLREHEKSQHLPRFEHKTKCTVSAQPTKSYGQHGSTGAWRRTHIDLLSLGKRVEGRWKTLPEYVELARRRLNRKPLIRYGIPVIWPKAVDFSFYKYFRLDCQQNRRYLLLYGVVLRSNFYQFHQFLGNARKTEKYHKCWNFVNSFGGNFVCHAVTLWPYATCFSFSIWAVACPFFPSSKY